MAKIRIDKYLVDNGYFYDIDEVKRFVMAGKVFVNEEKIASSAKEYRQENIKNIRIKNKKSKYVSRAGLKLEGAINYWNLDFSNTNVLDVGSSTGGFVDCALKHGAKKVFALDVGTNQLDYELRVNPNVEVYEQTNFRTIKKDFFKVEFDIITMDVSFISVSLLFDNVRYYLKNNGIFICLIKPQFEAPKGAKRENGIIVDEKIHFEVIESVKKSCLKYGLVVKEIIDSPIKGTKGNKEFLAYIVKQS